MVQKTNNMKAVFNEITIRHDFDILIFGNCYMKLTYNKQGLLESLKFIDPTKIKTKVKNNDKQK